ncbi:hypothetical protein [Catenuloplanes indicus]|uniref:Uncharacterized protein n=1 Tax=Catenuloplanes indicus TaxID=137267 RepID=A0AAE3VVT8_9ACTN|nr:hypothetical protein [Catenuloplanes indicus]MDQ0364958.1 hypothetical protein [Catenuloplanes indicus]
MSGWKSAAPEAAVRVLAAARDVSWPWQDLLDQIDAQAAHART